MSINVKELQAQREALVRTISDFKKHRDFDDPDAETLSGLLGVVDELLGSAPGVFTWQVSVETDYHDGISDGVIYNAPFTGTGEELEDYVQRVVKEFVIGVNDDDSAGNSTTITVKAVTK